MDNFQEFAYSVFVQTKTTKATNSIRYLLKMCARLFMSNDYELMHI